MIYWCMYIYALLLTVASRIYALFVVKSTSVPFLDLPERNNNLSPSSLSTWTFSRSLSPPDTFIPHLLDSVEDLSSSVPWLNPRNFQESGLSLPLCSNCPKAELQNVNLWELWYWTLHPRTIWETLENARSRKLHKLISKAPTMFGRR